MSGNIGAVPVIRDNISEHLIFMEMSNSESTNLHKENSPKEARRITEIEFAHWAQTDTRRWRKGMRGEVVRAGGRGEVAGSVAVQVSGRLCASAESRGGASNDELVAITTVRI
ncbi:unnamed protein product [Danaus chrysippus]|uniref:(African queen) hypothetical protein n=1 Tax=Danaus chrysippus TaxID=151541 RepID=A0A8J2QSC0_9NEOP|nr:unnamed protein product [Danaus chrysippus]